MASTATDSGAALAGRAAESKEEPVPGGEAEEEDWAEATDELDGLQGGIDPADASASVRVEQADPSTPYQSASSFEEVGLSEKLLKGVYHCKFNVPSKIQAASLPFILSRTGEYRNLIAQGHNGSGKTACFVLGMLSRIDFSTSRTQALCIVPTRELARQIDDVIHMLGKFTGVQTYLAVKDTEEERKAVRSVGMRAAITAHVVVGTPGKVMDLIKKRIMDIRSVVVVVLDEADEMVDTQGMGDQTIRIKRQLPRDVQVLLFSATFNDNVRQLAMKLAPNANKIWIERETLSLDSIKQYYIDTSSANGRYEMLGDIYGSLALGQSIIFVRTRQDAQALTEQLREDNHTVSVLYGGEMRPEERDRVIDEFRTGTTRVLVTTNVLSRGVDVLAVTAVINYDLPTDYTNQKADPDTYLHRIGRTGRFGRTGIAINFVYDDRTRRILGELERYYSKTIEKAEDAEELSEKLKAL